MRKTVLILLLLFFPLVSGAGSSGASVKSGPAGLRAKTAVVNMPSADVFAKNSKKSEQVSEVLLGDEFEVIRQEGEWAYGYIPSQKNYRGWVQKKDIIFPLSNSFFRDKSLIHVSTKECRILLKDGSYLNIYAGTRLPVLKKTDEQYEVLMPDGSTGFLSVESGLLENDHFGKDVTPKDIMFAAEFFGADYKWGGITVGGMDCSGFVYTVFRVNGIFLKRDSYMQAEEGSNIRLEELGVGDLVFFSKGKGKGSRITHVGIYIGNGNFIHSSKGHQGVAISRLSDDYFKKRFVTARRLLHNNDKAASLGASDAGIHISSTRKVINGLIF